jgi:hypothetical protein
MQFTDSYTHDYIFRGTHSDFFVFDFNAESLADDEIHIVSHITEKAFDVITAGIEYTLFHPKEKSLNEQFKICIMDTPIPLTICSIPARYKDKCIQIGQLFNIFLVSKEQTLTTTLEGKSAKGNIMMRHAQKENILWLVNFSPLSDEQIEKGASNIAREGKDRPIEINELKHLVSFN